MRRVEDFHVQGYRAFTLTEKELRIFRDYTEYYPGCVLVFEANTPARPGHEILIAKSAPAAFAAILQHIDESPPVFSSLETLQESAAPQSTSGFPDTPQPSNLISTLRISDKGVLIGAPLSQTKNVNSMHKDSVPVYTSDDVDDVSRAYEKRIEDLIAHFTSQVEGLNSQLAAMNAVSAIAESVIINEEAAARLLPQKHSELESAYNQNTQLSLTLLELDSKLTSQTEHVDNLESYIVELEADLAKATETSEQLARIEVSPRGVRSEVIETSEGSVRIIHEFPKRARPSIWRYYFSRLRQGAFLSSVLLALLIFWYMGSLLLSIETSGFDLAALDEALLKGAPSLLRPIFKALSKAVWWIIHLFS